MTKTYIITGAASGIGRGLAMRVLSEGGRVLACDVNTSALEGLRGSDHGDRLLTLALDVRNPQAWHEAVKRAIDHWGGVDVLCNVAGVLKENWCDQASASEVDFHIDINFKGTVFGVQAVLPHMLDKGSGHIVNVASLAALSPVPGLSLYSASKFAVRSYSLAIAMELAPKGIAVSTICPDAVQTPMLDIQMGKAETALTFSGRRALATEEVVQAILDAVKTGRMETVLPFEREVTAKLSNAFPAVAARAIGLFQRWGAVQQKRQAGKRGAA